MKVFPLPEIFLDLRLDRPIAEGFLEESLALPVQVPQLSTDSFL